LSHRHCKPRFLGLDNPFFRPLTCRPSLLSLPRLSRRRCLGFKDSLAVDRRLSARSLHVSSFRVRPPKACLPRSSRRHSSGFLFCTARITAPPGEPCRRFFVSQTGSAAGSWSGSSTQNYSRRFFVWFVSGFPRRWALWCLAQRADRPCPITLGSRVFSCCDLRFCTAGCN
jgi:hypothetical protein